MGGFWTDLCHWGRELKEELSRQMGQNPDWPVSLYISIPKPGGTSAFQGEVTLDRATFERETERTSERFKEVVLEGLHVMEVRKRDIKQVVLVGGGANLYLVPGLLRELFPGKPGEPVRVFTATRGRRPSCRGRFGGTCGRNPRPGRYRSPSPHRNRLPHRP